LDASLKAIRRRLKQARRAVAIVGFPIGRYGLQDKVSAFLASADFQYVTTGMSKAMLPESGPLFLGMYNGEFSPSVSAYVQKCDIVVDL